MTVQRLSAQSVKVQLSADELRLFLPETDAGNESPQMLRLISFMLAKAEAASGIAFSELPVTVELLTAPQGGLAAYFTVQVPPGAVPGGGQLRAVRIAARFSGDDALYRCCRQLAQHSSELQASALYRFREGYVLVLKLKHSHTGSLHHILMEFGRPFRLSLLNRARLAEYGTCLSEQDAVAAVCKSQSPRSSRTASAGDAEPSR
ncbi:MAG: adaptor protein MecA [Oscillospiraceae bacterium]|nr:adaptor protein MecA [Oscillospiraceae bacterium]